MSLLCARILTNVWVIGSNCFVKVSECGSKLRISMGDKIAICRFVDSLLIMNVEVT